MRICKKCSAPLPPQNGRHRPRKYCTDCHPPRGRLAVPAMSVVPDLDPGRLAGTLAEATADRLAVLGLAGDPAALLLLRLAKSIDDGGHSGSSLAALSREFSRSLASLSVGSPGEAESDGIQWGVR